MIKNEKQVHVVYKEEAKNRPLSLVGVPRLNKRPKPEVSSPVKRDLDVPDSDPTKKRKRESSEEPEHVISEDSDDDLMERPRKRSKSGRKRHQHDEHADEHVTEDQSQGSPAKRGPGRPRKQPSHVPDERHRHQLKRLLATEIDPVLEREDEYYAQVARDRLAAIMLTRHAEEHVVEEHVVEDHVVEEHVTVPTPHETVPATSAHVTGAARTEGYYKQSRAEKVRYIPKRRRVQDESKEILGQRVVSTGRDTRVNHRHFLSSLGQQALGGSKDSDLMKINLLKTRKKLLVFQKSEIHDWGLFALEPIQADDLVIEYIGEIIRQKVADEREKRYEAIGIGSSYMFRIDDNWIIDATMKGNLARFVNHCCDVRI